MQREGASGEALELVREHTPSTGLASIPAAYLARRRRKRPKASQSAQGLTTRHEKALDAEDRDR